ncbi:coat protein [Rhodoferax phage P26218]|uniref:major head protein n=1 Tax=Rhodoferax phage P26218 TaxID=1636270 RepID=UPI0005FEB4F6|nr:major head protein [Rhodoferax phage P26218]AKA60340.1 coat protein [Rhodoferax phage P26218]
MTNTLVTCSIVAKESLAILENMVAFAGMVNRDWEDEFTGNQSRGYSPGQTINIKRPPRYTYRSGRVAVPQATVETTIPLTLSQGGTDLNFTSFERTLSLQKLEDKLQAAMATVANEIDRQGLQLARQATFNTIGTPGTLPNTQALALGAITGINQRLDEMAAPRDKQRGLIMGPALNAATITGFAGLFNGQDKISKQFGSGMMVDSLGLAYAMDQNVDTHVNGTQAVAGTNINGANQTGASVTVVATGGTITRGSKITLPGVFAVNPQSRVSTGVLAQFTVTADVAGGATSIPISPAIVTSGAFQNVTASPTSGSPFVIFGTASGSYQANVGFHKDAFTLAMVPMWAPPGGKGVIDVAQETYKGFTIKVTEFYDGVNDNSIMRLDVLFGWAATYPELATIYAT